MPSWLCERGSGFTVASADWDDDFDAAGVTLYQFDFSTDSGYLVLNGNTTSYPVRAMLAFDSEFAYTVTGLLSTNNNVQVKFNGVNTAYAATAEITLNVQEGRNFLRIAHDGAAGSISFEGRLFDGHSARWVDLREMEL